jgi:hypothetical protein
VLRDAFCVDARDCGSADSSNSSLAANLAALTSEAAPMWRWRESVPRRVTACASREPWRHACFCCPWDAAAYALAMAEVTARLTGARDTTSRD